MPIVVFGLLFQLISCVPVSEPGTMPLNEESFKISSTISNHNVKAFSEDSFGHIWIGTDRGLNRYNGKEYYQYFRTEQENSLSNSTITNFFRDSRGREWIVNYGGACFYDSNDTFRRAKMNVEIKGSSDIVETEAGSIYIVTHLPQLLEYDEEKSEFNPVLQDVMLPSCLALYPSFDNCIWYVAQDEILHIDMSDNTVISRIPYPDSFNVKDAVMNDNGHILLYSSSAALCFNKSEQIFHSAPEWFRNIKDRVNEIDMIYIGSKINLVVTDAGTWFYDRNSGHLFHESDNGSPYIMPRVKPSTVFIDSRDNLWVGTSGKGYFMIPASGHLFNQNMAQISNFEGKNISVVDRDKNDGLWVIAEGKLCYSAKDGQYFETSLSDLELNPENNVYMTCNRSTNSVWIAAGNDLIRMKHDIQGGLRIIERLKMQSGKVRLLECSDSGIIYLMLRNGEFYTLHEDGQGGAECHLLSSFNERVYGLIYDILPMKDGQIALSMFRSPITILDPVTGSRKDLDYRKYIGEKFHLVTLLEDVKERIWFGTRDFGLYYMESDSCIQVSGLNTQAISSIEQDRAGNIWISNGNGISRYNMRREELINFTSENGFGDNQFNRNCSCVLSDGVVVFGGSNGLVSCHSIDIDTDKKYNIVFQNLKINNEYVYPGYGGNMDSVIFHKPQIRLRYDQNNVSISFALLDYRPYHTVNYRFKLEGQDEKWTEIGSDNMIYFSHLRPGRYTLKVDALTLDYDSVRGSEIDIIVFNPWWSSLVAKIIYMIVIITAVLLIIRQVRIRIISDVELEQAKKNYEQEKILHKMSYNLFGNIAHDLRSPLTMLAGPVSQFASDPQRSERDSHLIATMQMSIDRMNRLVNQILDFNKMDSGVLKLKLVRNYRMNDKMRDLVRVSLVYAEYRNVKMTVSGLEKEYIMSLDPDKFDSIVSNLVSNALKFVKTDEGKVNIEVYESSFAEIASRTAVRDADKSDEYICISIENNSLPISPSDMEKVFDRFYQIKRHGENQRRVGSGIGLSFAKALAELHHGYLWAENIANDEGVRFVLALPLTESVYRIEEYGDDESYDEEKSKLQISVKADNASVRPSETIMIVDDDIDIANYLSLLLESKYNVTICYDAEKALSMIRQGKVPDLILSDIMMPGIDGIELCSRIKSNASTCRIPIILITAKTDTDSKVEGLEYGADAYITKPFEPSFLMAQIASLLKNRILARGKDYELADILNVDISQISEADRAFIKKLIEVVKSSVSEPELDVIYLSKEMNISRSKLFYKIKDIFGISPNELLKRYKMEVAARLLNEGKYNVSEVAYRVGFSSLSYFSKAFKQQFGKLPKEVKGS